MRTLLRRIRGAIGVGATWAVAWGLVGTIPRWVLGIDGDVPFPLIFGFAGGIAGVVFAGILAAVEGRRRFDEMSVPRFAGLGAVGGSLLAIVIARVTGISLGETLLLVPAYAIASTVCASGSLMLARRPAQGSLVGDGGVETLPSPAMPTAAPDPPPTPQTVHRNP